MPAAKDKPEAGAEEAAPAEAPKEKRYAVKEGFHGYIDTQLVKFEKDFVPDKHVVDWLLSHNGESHLRELD